MVLSMRLGFTALMGVTVPTGYLARAEEAVEPRSEVCFAVPCRMVAPGEVRAVLEDAADTAERAGRQAARALVLSCWAVGSARMLPW